MEIRSIAGAANERDLGGYGNAVLYKMCEDRPYHTKPEDIYSKLWLIGRAYAAPLERRAGSDFRLEDAAKKLASLNIDRTIERVDHITYLGWSNLNIAVEVHAELMAIFREVSKLNRPSLASKYLHFHRPNAFFIYDSIVTTRVAQLLRSEERKRELARHKTRNHPGNPYPAFCSKIMLYRDLEMPGSSPRQVDWSLWRLGRLPRKGTQA